MDTSTQSGTISPSVRARDFLGESVDQLDFLGLQDGAKRTALQSWLMEGKTLDAPKDALRLAECFRDLAAHGLLSASRAEKLGIVGRQKNRSAFVNLPNLEIFFPS